jgi:hypothetical protein
LRLHIVRSIDERQQQLASRVFYQETSFCYDVYLETFNAFFRCVAFTLSNVSRLFSPRRSHRIPRSYVKIGSIFKTKNFHLLLLTITYLGCENLSQTSLSKTDKEVACSLYPAAIGPDV